MHSVRSTVFVLLGTGLLMAQPQDRRPAYEAASIKVSAGGRGSSSNGSRGQVVITNNTLHRLIERAYNVKPLQVVGPSWLDDVRFDIAAKYPAEMDPAERFVMLRTLLEDRLKLAAHRETRDMPGYALVVSKGGFKLKPAAPGGSTIDHEGRGNVNTLKASSVSMVKLADFVERFLGETTIDRTGIDGVYDFDLRWTREENAISGDPDSNAAMVVALRDALGAIGLRLQAQRVPVEVVVVDRVERVPTEN